MDQEILNSPEIDLILDRALKEDIGAGDVTTNTLFDEASGATAIIKAKAPGTLAGLPIAAMVFRKLDTSSVFLAKKKEGESVQPGDVLAEISGSLRGILTGERVALNFLQHLSGVATETAMYVKALEGLPTKILDTRKTTPGLRLLEKYAVRMGGGSNHRMGLHDAVLIKDNHIAAAGGIRNAVESVRKTAPPGMTIEVETTNLGDVRDALDAGADIIMLDNMNEDEMREAVVIVAGKAKLEASGGVSLESVRRIAETGVDFVSIGSITHSAPILDIALYVV